jgi:transcriptional regulator with GAF, ATPase, and Fis domain
METLIPLTDSAEFARLLVAAMPCGILIVDERGRSHAVNDIPGRTLGFGPEIPVIPEKTGAFACLSPEEDCSAVSGENRNAQALGLEAIRRNRRMRARGKASVKVNQRRREIAVMMTAVPLEHGKRRFAAVLFQDISDLQLLAPEYEEGFRGIIGRETVMQDLFDTIRQVSPTNAPVLIQGESGTGKELVAQAIHRESPRANAHFVPFNCGALPEGLVESELFGHVKGAFTGAVRDKKGRFELAQEGTIFLDEIGELKMETQVKLLRVLQEGRLERVGGEQTVQLDVRVISATNRNLEREVARKRFREDLYYRICVMPIRTPPLRKRQGDIPLLARFFLSRFGEENGLGGVAASDEVLDILSGYEWPGNVRELQNVIQYALVKSQGNTILPDHLPPAVRSDWTEKYKVRKKKDNLSRGRVYKVLDEVGGNKKQAAEVLGVSRSTLYRLLARFE